MSITVIDYSEAYLVYKTCFTSALTYSTQDSYLIVMHIIQEECAILALDLIRSETDKWVSIPPKWQYFEAA